MLHVYIDTGGLHPIVRELEADGLLRTHHFPFENRNAKVTKIVSGSGATWEQSKHVTWESDSGSWDDDEPSPLFDQVLRLVGGQRVDAQHLDSAFKARCILFLSSDKGDIWLRREPIFMLTGLTVLHMPSQLDELALLCKRSSA